MSIRTRAKAALEAFADPTRHERLMRHERAELQAQIDDLAQEHRDFHDLDHKNAILADRLREESASNDVLRRSHHILATSLAFIADVAVFESRLRIRTIARRALDGDPSLLRELAESSPQPPPIIDPHSPYSSHERQDSAVLDAEAPPLDAGDVLDS